MCRRTSIQDKIMANVLIQFTGFMIDGTPSPCHIWQGPHSGAGRGGGYPRMSLDGQTVAVHIVSFTNKNGFVPGKKQIDHMCNQRMCVNQDHLQMVTHKKNQKLRIQRSRKVTDALPVKFSELPSNGSSILGSGREGVFQFEGILGSESQGDQEDHSSRHLPDHAYW